MRIVLQDIKTGSYFTGSGWTRHIGEALDFASSRNAIKYIRHHHLHGVQILVAFVEPAFVETVALQMPAATQELKSAA